MELGSRKHDDAASRRQQPHVRLQFDGFECLWLRTRVDADLLGGMEAAVAVPLLVVVAVRAVAQSVGEITRVKSHAIGRVDGKYRQPPVDLAHRRRVPGVAMRVKRVSDTGAQVIIAGRGSQARHVEIALARVVVDVYHAVLRWRAATSSGSSLRGILPPTYSPPPRHAAASSPGTCLCRTMTSSVASDSWPAGDESLP